MKLRGFFVRVTNLFTGDRGDARLRAEIQEHIALQTEENLRAGMAPDEARRQALLKFGSAEVIQETYHAQRSLPFVETLLQDVRYGIRVLAKNPGFTIISVLTLALGIGANTAIFSIVYGVVFRPLPYPQPQNIVQLTQSSPRGSDEQDVTYSQLAFLKEHATGFESLAGYTVVGFNLGVHNNTVRVKAAPVSPDYFRVLGIQPMLGRDFVPQDNGGNGSRVAILSYPTWQRQAGGDPNIVGQTITLGAEPYTVIGVMPRQLELLNDDPIIPGKTEVWTPLALVGKTVGSGENIAILGRLRAGTSLPQAASQMRNLTTDFRKEFPQELGPGMVLSLQSYQEMLASGVRPMLLTLFGAVGFVLLIACANVANLLLGRAQVRGRELAVRAALGASRARLIRQLLTESVLLSFAAGLLALLLAGIGMRFLLALTPSDLPRLSEIHLDAPAFAFTLGIAVFAGMVFGLAPAFRASAGEIQQKLREGSARTGTGREHGRLRSTLAVGEVALCMVLLTGAALLIETFSHVLKTDPGFNPSRVLSLEVWLGGARYNSAATSDRLYAEVLRRVRALPAVQSASVVAAGLPLERGGNAGVSVDGKTVQVAFGPRMIEPEYFRTMGIPIVLGRALSESDNGGSPPIAVVSRSAANHLFAGANPVGRKLKLFDVEREVVGVVGDVKSYLDQPPELLIYIPLSQSPSDALNLYASYFPTSIVVRTSAEPLTLARAVQQQLSAIDPTIAAGHARAMDEVRSASVATRQFDMTLLSIFAGLALLLAMVGIYGVIAYGVTQRRQEFGVRLALGASRRSILQLVLRQGIVFGGLGVLIGVAGALGLERLLRSYLYGVAPSDPWALGTAAVLMAIVAVLASVVPAFRATRFDPIVALRYE
ncbi:MAG TPA: ABC transporter permease [Candidatus Koribacter sp.]|jgi:putative ABC transport system permease protein